MTPEQGTPSAVETLREVTPGTLPASDRAEWARASRDQLDPGAGNDPGRGGTGRVGAGGLARGPAAAVRGCGVTTEKTASTPGCGGCSQKNGHQETGGVHEPWHCKPDLCPDRVKHAENVYGNRLSRRYSGMTRDGVTTVVQIDGVDATKTHEVERCICGLLLIWTPKASKPEDGAS
jgi:hypothetical protein